ncbi:MAG: hypothetical protein WC352_06815 [Candidatus Omnitrophota bacterium]|jgi:hypothetical protein
MKKLMAALLVLGVACVLPVSGAWAYQEEVGVMSDEIWKALHDMLGPGGIEREDRAKGEMLTAWKEDVVRRGHGRFEKWIKQTYRRRTQFRVRLMEKTYTTVIQINGSFGEQQLNGPSNSMWKSVKPQTEDYIQELDFFKAFMRQLSQNRAANPRPPLEDLSSES